MLLGKSIPLRAGGTCARLGTAVTLAAAGSGAWASVAEATTSPACPAPVISGTTAMVTCSYTGALHSWTVPDGVTQASITAYGAQGGVAYDGEVGNFPGGLGAELGAGFTVNPGDTLNVLVGGQGAADDAGGGGGGSFVYTTADQFGLLVAAAGGGGGQGGAPGLSGSPNPTTTWSFGDGPGGTSGGGGSSATFSGRRSRRAARTRATGWF